jgi:hypothetical protein
VSLAQLRFEKLKRMRSLRLQIEKCTDLREGIDVDRGRNVCEIEPFDVCALRVSTISTKLILKNSTCRESLLSCMTMDLKSFRRFFSLKDLCQLGFFDCFSF